MKDQPKLVMALICVLLFFCIAFPLWPLLNPVTPGKDAVVLSAGTGSTKIAYVALDFSQVVGGQLGACESYVKRMKTENPEAAVYAFLYRGPGGFEASLSCEQFYNGFLKMIKDFSKEKKDK